VPDRPGGRARPTSTEQRSSREAVDPPGVVDENGSALGGRQRRARRRGTVFWSMIGMPYEIIETTV
jgi:hypothetical protein